MPLIQVTLIEEVLSPVQKQKLITRMNEAIAEVAGEAMRGMTWVVFDEARRDDWGLNTQPYKAAPSGGVQ
jgi:4-oxalocrotonate tautomerase